MEEKLGANQLKAWEMFITRQSIVLRKIEKDLEGKVGVLPLHWYDVLLVLSHAPEMRLRLSDIADRIVTSRSALTRSVEKLEAHGYLIKEPCEEDKRGQYASITEAGTKAMKATWIYYRKAIQNHFAQFFTSKEAQTLEQLLQKIPGPL